MHSLTYGNTILNRFVRWAAAKRWPSAVLAQILHRIDPPLLRLSKGRRSFTQLLAGLPVVTVVTTGAKSGLPRPIPLVGIPSDGALAVIASNFGRKKHAAWYYNLRAYPEVDVIIRGETIRCRAELAAGEHYQQIWQKAKGVYPGYTNYKQRGGDRHIPIFLLKPI